MSDRKKNSATVASPPSEAAQARQNAEERLRDVQELWPEVRSITQSFRLIRRDNHFAERIAEAHRA